MYELTKICRIGIKKTEGNEWADFIKAFEIKGNIVRAELRMTSQGICAAFINGEFLEATPGRYPNRVAAFEITSLLKQGVNEIKLKTGSSYFQEMGELMHKSRGAWLSWAAAELIIQTDEGKLTVTTDENWKCISDDGQALPQVFGAVSQAEYDDIWSFAALWREKCEEYPEKIKRLVGKGVSHGEKVLEPISIKERESSLVLDFGRTVVGYFEIEYIAEGCGTVTLRTEYTESEEDLFQPREWWGTTWLNRLECRTSVKDGHSSFMLYRRRAGHFYKITSSANVKIVSVKLHTSMMPPAQEGYFNCDDEMLNKIWQVGAYTLKINRHHEWESCPRKEMLYFAGDGAVDALNEFYTFGRSGLTGASLSTPEVMGDNGRVEDIHARAMSLCDYPAWRILTIWADYFYSGDIELLKHFYADAVEALEYYIDKRGKDDLIYMLPVKGDQFWLVDGALDYTGGTLRLGKRPYLNALFYASLRKMAELAEIVGDERGREWNKIADSLKSSFNSELWNEERKLFTETYDTSLASQDGNALAVLFGIVEGERSKAILEKMKEVFLGAGGSVIVDKKTEDSRCSNDVIAPMFNMYEAQARFEQGDVDGAMEVIRSCWGTMLEKGAETFWEYAPNDKTTRWNIPAHAWSSGSSYLLSAYVLGIRPKEAGYKTLLFAPIGTVNEFKGVVPTVRGYVAATLRTENGIKHYELCIPKGMNYEYKIDKNSTIEIAEY